MIEFEGVKQKLGKQLIAKAPNLKCPVCASNDFTLIEGFFNRPIQKELSGSFSLGGPAVPTVGIVCVKCGYLMEFSAIALDLIDPTNLTNKKFNEGGKKKK